MGLPNKEYKKSRGSDSDEEEEPQHLVKFEVYKKAISEIRKNIKDIREKVFETGREGEGSDGSSPNQGSRLVLPGAGHVLGAKGLNDINQIIKQKSDQMELMKEEMKIELKRLQRQNFAVNNGFEEQQEFLDSLSCKIDTFEKKLVLTDTSMATIFKLLRIQYALSHQDEVDKQQIFLAGHRETRGQRATQPPPAATYDTNSIDVEEQSLMHDNQSLASNHPNVFSA